MKKRLNLLFATDPNFLTLHFLNHTFNTFKGMGKGFGSESMLDLALAKL
ncbi:hypothetical protein L4D77_19185 [Photobacterium frigidiphilum]